MLALTVRAWSSARHASGGGYKLTLQGEELRQSAERVEVAVAAFERDAAACDRGLTGTIRVTTAGFAAECLRKSGLIDAFHMRFRGLSLELVVSDRCLDLSKGEADVAIQAGEPRDQALVGRKLADVPWAIHAAQSYIDRHGALNCVGIIGNSVPWLKFQAGLVMTFGQNAAARQFATTNAGSSAPSW